LGWSLQDSRLGNAQWAGGRIAQLVLMEVTTIVDIQGSGSDSRRAK
jgi:hypothetical protein